MAVGANIIYPGHPSLWRKLTQLLLQKRFELRRSKHLCYKNGAPANNTVADNPNAINDICLDMTNNHAYICTAYTANASATTWTQIA